MPVASRPSPVSSNVIRQDLAHCFPVVPFHIKIGQKQQYEMVRQLQANLPKAKTSRISLLEGFYRGIKLLKNKYAHAFPSTLLSTTLNLVLRQNWSQATVSPISRQLHAIRGVPGKIGGMAADINLGGYLFSKRLRLKPSVYHARVGVREANTECIGTTSACGLKYQTSNAARSRSAA